jgi:hypothetical protein
MSSVLLILVMIFISMLELLFLFLFTMIMLVDCLHDTLNYQADCKHVDFGLVLVRLQEVDLS